MEIDNKVVVAVSVGWLLILCFWGANVVTAEYYSLPQINQGAIVGGQIQNFTMRDNGYEYTFFDGQNFYKGFTDHKVSENDYIYQYTVYDSVSIPYIYTPRIWIQTELNNVVIESSKTHEPLTLLTSVTALTLGIYLLVGVKQVIKNKKNKSI